MFHEKTKRTLISLAVASACAHFAPQAYAQEQESNKAAEVETGTKAKKADTAKNEVQEVTVTATRRTTSLLKTPLAVTAFSQEKLSKQGITNLAGISGELPNVQMDGQANDSAVKITIRGITATNFTEIGDPSAGLHIDGLYSPRPQGAQALMFDLDQVEVLRGPQGTLFGRNSTAGSINIIPAKPEFGSTYGSASVETGSLNLRNINVIQNIAVNDKLALRATLMKVTRDSPFNQMQDFSEANIPALGWKPDGIPDVTQRFNTKVSKADGYNNQNQWAGRLAARLKVNDDLEWQLAYEHFQDSGAGYIGMRDCDQAAGTRWACTRGQYDVLINVPGKVDMSIDTVRSKALWNVNKNTSLEYGFVYANQQRSQVHDDDGGISPYPFEVTGKNPVDGNWAVWPISDNLTRTLNSKYLSTVHELQLKQSFDNWQYVAGAFWMHEKNAINFGQEQMHYGPNNIPISQFYAQPDRQIDSKALFAQADWKFAPLWTATVGARYTRDSKTDKGGMNYGGNSWGGQSYGYYNGMFDYGIPGTDSYRTPNGNQITPQMGSLGGAAAYAGYGPGTNNDHSDSWSKGTYRLGLQAQLTPSDMVYAALATGYKSGGFGDRTNKCGQTTCVYGENKKEQITYLTYKPETVTNFELGYKGKLLDNRLALSVVLFAMQYKDMQQTGSNFLAKVTTPDNLPCPSWAPTCDVATAWQTVNVAKVNLSGLETEWDYRPWPGAKLGGFFSYLKSVIHDYDSYDDGYACDQRAEFGAVACPAVYLGTDDRLRGRRAYNLEGNQMPNAPKFTFGLNFSQEFALDNGYTLTPWIGMRWQDKVYFDLRNFDNPHIGLTQKAYAKGDVSLKLVAPNDKWFIEAYVRNFTDVKAKTNGWNAGGGKMAASYVDQRSFGIKVGASY